VVENRPPGLDDSVWACNIAPMRAKAIADLIQLSDRRLFSTVAEGLTLIVKNAKQLYEGASAVGDRGQPQSSRVLAAVAEEEASKALILLDVIRCPPAPRDRVSAQLKRFKSHLAKGLYAKVYGYYPQTLGELQRALDLHRRKYYLDGPTGVDWKFRNEVSQSREGLLYVDYVVHDEGAVWWDPAQVACPLSSTSPEPFTVKVVRQMGAAGLFTAESLAVVAEIWRATPPTPETQFGEVRAMNVQTLDRLDSKGLLKEQAPETYSCLVEHWQFPMYDLDLTEISVDPPALREQRDNWSPDDYP
jgi:AbiV family abortive infection protein